MQQRSAWAVTVGAATLTVDRCCEQGVGLLGSALGSQDGWAGVPAVPDGEGVISGGKAAGICTLIFWIVTFKLAVGTNETGS